MTANDFFRICADVESPILLGADLLKMEHGEDLVKMELVRKSGVPAEASCPICYGEHFGRTGTFHPENGKYSFRCPQCGHMLIEARDLENWKLDYDALVRLTAKKIGCGAVREEVRGHLWNLGFSSTGFSKPVWIVRKYCSEKKSEIDRCLPNDPRAVFFSMGHVPQNGIGKIPQGRITPLFELVEIGGSVRLFPGVADYLKPLKLEAETAPNRLIVSGDSWLVRFDGGENLMVRHQKGFVYLAVLLEHPGEDVSVLDLTKTLNENEGQSFLSGTAEFIDVQALREYRRRIEAIRNRIADGDYRSAEEKAALEQEQTKICNEVRNAVTATGHLRKRNSQLDKPRQAVYRAIQRAIESLKSAGAEDMAEHFEQCIRTGNLLRYSPPSHMDWEVFGI